MAKTLIVIAGPTAIGKTALAIKLAQYFNTEIISADSRQFYKEMEIGTAKPSPEELKAVRHYFINSHSVTNNFSVGDYEREGIQLIEELFKHRDTIILVGGSGLFINAIVKGFDELPVATSEIRSHLNQLLLHEGISHLQEKLAAVDPVYYQEVDISNPQRIIRALEVYEITGKPFSHFRSKTIKQRPFNVIQLGLNTERGILYDQINTRVNIMIEKGLVNEVERLKTFRHLNPLNTVGYSELFTYLDGKVTLDEAIEKIKQNTRRFAKRQLTWFNKSEDLKWFKPDEFEDMVYYLNERLQYPAHGEQKS